MHDGVLCLVVEDGSALLGRQRASRTGSGVLGGRVVDGHGWPAQRGEPVLVPLDVSAQVREVVAGERAALAGVRLDLNDPDDVALLRVV